MAKGKKGVVVSKPKSNVYTVMLAISLVAILMGITCLYLEMKAYGFDITAQGARGGVSVPSN